MGKTHLLERVPNIKSNGGDFPCLTHSVNSRQGLIFKSWIPDISRLAWGRSYLSIGRVNQGLGTYQCGSMRKAYEATVSVSLIDGLGS